MPAFARVWDVATGAAVTPLLPHEAGISGATFSPDGTRALTASDDGTAAIWDLRSTSAAHRVLLRHSAAVRRAEFSGDGGRVLTIADSVRVWNTADGSWIATAPGELSWATIDSTGARLVGLRAVWEVGSRSLRELSLPQVNVHAVSLSSDGRRAAFAIDLPWPERDSVLVLDVASGGRAMPGIAPDDLIDDVKFSPDGSMILAGGSLDITGNQSNGMRVLRARSGEVLTGWLAHEASIKAASFSNDGRWVVSLDITGAVRVWASGSDSGPGLSDQLLRAPITHAGRIVSAQFRPRTTELMTAGGNEVRIWDLSPERPRPAPETVGPLAIPAMQGVEGVDGWRVSLGAGVQGEPASRDLNVENPKLWKKPRVFRFPEPITGLWSAPRGGSLVITGEDGGVWIWSFERDELRLRGHFRHASRVGHVEFPPDGRRIATAASDEVRVWDARTGEAVAPPLPGSGHAAFSPDGAWVAVLDRDEDGTVRVWNVASGEAVTPVLYPNRIVERTWFNQDGTILYGSGPGDELPIAWCLARETRDVDVLRVAVEVLSSRRLDETGAVVPAASARETRAYPASAAPAGKAQVPLSACPAPAPAGGAQVSR
jgi:WD40 repeat protein